MSNEFKDKNTVLIIGKRSLYITCNIINKIMEANNIETMRIFTDNSYETELSSIWENQQKTKTPLLLHFQYCTLNEDCLLSVINAHHNSNIFIVITIQHPIEFTPRIITNFWYIIACKETSIIKDLYRFYFHIPIEPFEVFSNAMDKLNDDEALCMSGVRVGVFNYDGTGVDKPMLLGY